MSNENNQANLLWMGLIILVIIIGVFVFFSNKEKSIEGVVQEQAQSSANNNIIEKTGTDTVTINVEGSNMMFDKKEIIVKKGQTVKIVFINKQGFHDWVVDEFQAATEQISAGQTSEVTFVADKSGEFEYYCSVGDHRKRGMIGKLIVEES